jgi:hypothetical protein
MELEVKFWYQRLQRNKSGCFDTMIEYLAVSIKATSERVKTQLNISRQLQNSFEEHFAQDSSGSN